MTVPVPLFVDQTTGAPVTGPASVQVYVQGANGGATSNSLQFSLTGFATVSPLTPGSVTVGFLQGELAALQAYQQSISGTASDTPQFEAMYTNLVNSVNSIITQLKSAMTGAPVSLGTMDGSFINVNTAVLQNSDSALISLLSEESQLSSSAFAAKAYSVRKASSQGTTGTSSTIQQDALATYKLATSSATTQSQLSSSVATLETASANTSDPYFNVNSLLVMGGIIASIGIVALAPALIPAAVLYSNEALFFITAFTAAYQANPDLFTLNLSTANSPEEVFQDLTDAIIGGVANQQGVGDIYDLTTNLDGAYDNLLAAACGQAGCNGTATNFGGAWYGTWDPPSNGQAGQTEPLELDICTASFVGTLPGGVGCGGEFFPVGTADFCWDSLCNVVYYQNSFPFYVQGNAITIFIPTAAGGPEVLTANVSATGSTPAMTGTVCQFNAGKLDLCGNSSLTYYGTQAAPLP